MRKRKSGRKLGRKRNQRKALLKGLASTLILKEKIKTTEIKAKEVSRFVEKQISLARQSFSPAQISEKVGQVKEQNLGGRAKIGTLRIQRLLRKYFSHQIVKKLINEIAPRYKDRPGGYTRIIKLGPRKSDGAKIAIIELVK